MKNVVTVFVTFWAMLFCVSSGVFGEEKSTNNVTQKNEDCHKFSFFNSPYDMVEITQPMNGEIIKPDSVFLVTAALRSDKPIRECVFFVNTVNLSDDSNWEGQINYAKGIGKMAWVLRVFPDSSPDSFTSVQKKYAKFVEKNGKLIDSLDVLIKKQKNLLKNLTDFIKYRDPTNQFSVLREAHELNILDTNNQIDTTNLAIIQALKTESRNDPLSDTTIVSWGTKAEEIRKRTMATCQDAESLVAFILGIKYAKSYSAKLDTFGEYSRICKLIDTLCVNFAQNFEEFQRSITNINNAMQITKGERSAFVPIFTEVTFQDGSIAQSNIIYIITSRTLNSFQENRFLLILLFFLFFLFLPSVGILRITYPNLMQYAIGFEIGISICLASIIYYCSNELHTTALFIIYLAIVSLFVFITRPLYQFFCDVLQAIHGNPNPIDWKPVGLRKQKEPSQTIHAVCTKRMKSATR